MAKKKVKKKIEDVIDDMDVSPFEDEAPALEEVVAEEKPKIILKKAAHKDKESDVKKPSLTGQSKTKFKQAGTNNQSRKEQK